MMEEFVYLVFLTGVNRNMGSICINAFSTKELAQTFIDKNVTDNITLNIVKTQVIKELL